MKELSIEEKAKRYDEVIAMAKECITYIPDKAVNKYMLSMFPELKETEDGRDERIRKEIIKYIESRKITPNHPIADEWIAWLEKQGNNANKVESIFEVGKWIVANVSKYTFLLKRGAPRFQAEGTNGDIYSFYLLPNGEEEYHLWTIEDAKEGDVLVTDSGKPFIFKGCLDERHPNSPVAYCGIDCGNDFCVCDSISWWTGENVYPATKEQCDLLFAEMKEAGYEWNVEKKELKKIEQTVEIPFGAKDSELQEATYHIPDGYHAKINGNTVVVKKGELINNTPSQDHWQNVREMTAIAAMRKTIDMLTHDYQSFHNIVVDGFSGKQKTFPNEIADFAVECADALVKKLKGE